MTPSATCRLLVGSFLTGYSFVSFAQTLTPLARRDTLEALADAERQPTKAGGLGSTSDITGANAGWTPVSDRWESTIVTALGNNVGIESTLTLTGISNTTLCAGNVVSVFYSTSGPAFATNPTVEVWASDATGSFVNPRRLGSGTSSPISLTLLSDFNALPYGTNYRFKAVAPAADAESGASDALAIGNLTSATVSDRRGNANNSYTNATICPNSRVTLTAYARNGGYNPTVAEGYQWTLNGTVLANATSQTVSAQQAGTYQATIRQAGCTVQSIPYQLSASNTPSVSVQSPVDDAPHCDDRPATLSSNYVGETGAYQWTRNGADMAGANSTTLSTNQTGSYAFRLTDGTCVSTASPRPLTFGRSLFAQAVRYPSIDSVLCAGSFSSIYLVADRISPDQLTAGKYAVQWYRDNVALTGTEATRTDYYANQPGVYWFELRQGSCAIRSNALVVGQGVSVAPVVSTYSFRSRNACPGETRFLFTEAVTGNYAYQWQKDGVDIPGATTSSYSAQSSGAYTIRVTRGSCQATSLPLSLTFSNAPRPAAYVYGFSAESCSGTQLNANDSYHLSNYQYQWFRDGTAISGATHSGVFAGQAGAYSVQVTNGSCTGRSNVVSVKTGQAAKPVLSINQPGNQACGNNSFRLTATYNSGSLHWKRNGVSIPGATSYQYYATQSGLYSAALQDGSCAAESDPVEIKVGEPTSATLAGNALISTGMSSQLPITFSGPAPWSFTLTSGQSVQHTHQNPYLLPVSPTTTTAYALSAVSNACGTGTPVGSATVTVGNGSADVSLNVVVSNRSPRVNDVINYTFVLTNAGPQAAAGLRVSSRLPAGLRFVEAVSPGVSVAGDVVSADAGTLVVNGTASIRFRAKATQPGGFATAAQVVASQTPDPDSQPNSGTGDGQDDAATADLRTPDAGGPLVASANPAQLPQPRVSGNQPTVDPTTADLSLSMSVPTLTPTPNDVLTVTLRVSNRGGSAASAIGVQTRLPNGWGLTDPAGFIVNGQTVSGYLNQLPAGQSATLTLPVRVGSTAGRISAQLAEMAETDPDSTPGNGYGNGEDDEASVSVRLR